MVFLIFYTKIIVTSINNTKKPLEEIASLSGFTL